MKFSKAQFTIDVPGKTFITEASDLQSFNPRQQMVIVSDMGCEATFQCEDVNYTNDEDHELTDWVFRPTSESLKEIPRLDGWSVVVFND